MHVKLWLKNIPFCDTIFSQKSQVMLLLIVEQFAVAYWGIKVSINTITFPRENISMTE